MGCSPAAKFGALIGTALLVAGCSSRGRGSARPSRPVKHPNVMLIVIETLRADHVGCYGYTPSPTPNLDALANQGVRFSHLYANAPWTLPSVASLFTSRYPSECGLGRAPGESVEHIQANYLLALAPGLPTLAETFRAAGYSTRGATANMYLGPAYQVDFRRGFEHYWGATSPKEETADVLTRLVLRKLQTDLQEPFFMWLQYMDPHAPYAPPQLSKAPPGSEEEALRQHPLNMYHNDRFTDVQKARLGQLYDLEIAFADQHIGTLMDGLKKRGLDRRTIIFVTSDHGEEFWEHGGIGHGQSLYDEQLHVPGILLLPWQRGAAQVVSEQVRLIDVAPTLAALAGVPAPEGWEGEPFWDLGGQRKSASRTVLAEGVRYRSEQRGGRSPRYKSIEHAKSGALEVYDLRTDPGEKTNLASRTPPEAHDFVESVRQWAGQMNRSAEEFRPKRLPRTRPLSQRQKEMLRSLGYL